MLELSEIDDASPIHIMAFSKYFLSNTFHLKDSIDIKNYFSQVQLLNKEIIIKCLAIKYFV